MQLALAPITVEMNIYTYQLECTLVMHINVNGDAFTNEQEIC